MPSKFRFDLFTLLTWTAALGVAFAIISGFSEFRSVTWRFSSLPPDDAALDKWLVENGHAGVTVERKSKFVTFETRNPALPGGALVLPHQVPWEGLGYRSPEVDGGSSGLTVFGTSIYPWLVGFGVLVALHFLRRRFTTSSRPTGSP